MVKASREQLRMFLFNEVHQTTAYNIPIVYVLRGTINVDFLKQSFQSLVNKHESLRSTFHYENDELYCITMQDAEVSFEYKEVPDSTNLDTFFRNFYTHRFDLRTGPLFMVQLVKAKGCYYIFVLYHHIIVDAWSQGIIIHDLISSYFNQLLGIEYSDKPEVSVAEVLELKQRYIQSNNYLKSKEYWVKKIQQQSNCYVNLPKKGGARNFDGERLFYYVDTYKNREFIKKHHLTSNVYFATILDVAIYFVTNQLDFFIGNQTACRFNNKYENFVGFMANCFLHKSLLSTSDSFSELIKKNRMELFESLAHSEFPFIDLLPYRKEADSGNINPFFNVFINYNNTYNPNNEIDIDSDVVTDLEILETEDFQGFNKSKFDLTLFINDLPEQCRFVFEYSARLEQRPLFDLIQMFIFLVEYFNDEDHWNKPFQEVKNYALENADKLILERKKVEEIISKYVRFSRSQLDQDFYKVGGNSLLLLRIFTEIKNEFSIDLTQNTFVLSSFTIKDMIDGIVFEYFKETTKTAYLYASN